MRRPWKFLALLLKYNYRIVCLTILLYSKNNLTQEFVERETAAIEEDLSTDILEILIELGVQKYLIDKAATSNSKERQLL